MESKFAKTQLTKHGWTDGAGLGRNESGIKEAIKVTLKHDTAGVGHDSGEQFTFHWWDHVFNKAASNITVETNEDGVAVKKTTETGTISARKRKTYDNKAMLYGQFIKGATLSGDSYTPENDLSADDSEEEYNSKSSIIPANEEEIFRKCGGRTAHKAARHGLKLNGKLVRIQQQERELLDKLKASANQHQEKHLQPKDVPSNEKSGCKANMHDCLEFGDGNDPDKLLKKKKKSKKKKKVKCELGTDRELGGGIEIETIEESSDLSDVKMKSKKSRKRKNKDILDRDENSKKEKQQTTKVENEVICSTVNEVCENLTDNDLQVLEVKSKRKKKKKSKDRE